LEIENGARFGKCFNPTKGYGFIQPQDGGNKKSLHRRRGGAGSQSFKK
jgi:hypothetical protein